MFFKNKLTLIDRSILLIGYLFKTLFSIFKMNINHIFDLFNDQSLQSNDEDDETSLLVDFSEHPFYWIGGFNKVIANHSYFQQYTVKMFKDASPSLDEDEVELAGNHLMFEKAWGYIKDIKLTNQFHVECLGKKASFGFCKNLEYAVQHFEQFEEYEKCALLKDIEIKVKEFLK
jgi:hypothetical protein